MLAERSFGEGSAKKRHRSMARCVCATQSRHSTFSINSHSPSSSSSAVPPQDDTPFKLISAYTV